MKKSDLRLCDIVEYRNGEKRMVGKVDGEGRILFSRSEGWDNLSHYQEDLMCIFDDIPGLDIMKVYRPTTGYNLARWDAAPCIWERPRKTNGEKFKEVFGLGFVHPAAIKTDWLNAPSFRRWLEEEYKEEE